MCLCVVVLVLSANPCSRRCRLAHSPHRQRIECRVVNITVGHSIRVDYHTIFHCGVEQKLLHSDHAGDSGHMTCLHGAGPPRQLRRLIHLQLLCNSDALRSLLTDACLHHHPASPHTDTRWLRPFFAAAIRKTRTKH